ncbi:MAG: aldo/keto reductase [Myxococcaceae bacterium]|nr:aldo/keto reductase [Myxococcaceae bacterium]
MAALVLGTSALAPASFVNVVRAAPALGVRSLDAAPYYGEVLQLLAVTREADALGVTTRIPCVGDPSLANVDAVYPAGWVARSVEQQLRASGRTHFDLVLLERWDGRWHPTRVAAEARAAIGSGACRAFGVSLPDTNPEAALDLVACGPFTVVQGDTSLMRRRFVRDFAPRYRSLGARIQGRAPFFHGALRGDFDREGEAPRNRRHAGMRRMLQSLNGAGARQRYLAWAGERGLALEAVALAFALSEVDDVVVGVSSAAQLGQLGETLSAARALSLAELASLPDVRVGE